MVKSLKNKATRVLSVLICFALALGVFTALLSLRGTAARADGEIDYTNFETETINVSNNQFANGSGSAPKTPDSWTAGGIADCGAGGAFGGIMDLDTYQSNIDNYKINTVAPTVNPNSPFGSSAYPGTNRNVLLVNVPEDGSKGTAYGYTSSNITLTANRYYHIIVWVRTCDFAENSGAAIRLNGLGKNIAFNNINTVKGLSDFTPENSYGWEEFEFYIAASSYADQTVTIGLQVGDRYVDENDSTNNDYKPAYGYALFDNVQAYQVSPSEFLNARPSDNTIVADFSAKTSQAFDSITNLDFANGTAGWTLVEKEGTDISNLPIGVYNGNIAFEEENDYFFTSNPVSSLGRYSKDSNILVISSYTAETVKKDIAAGFCTPSFTLERYHYYRLSAWVKTQDVSGGNGATLALSVVRNPDADRYDTEKGNLFSTITSCTGDSDNRARGGFKQYSFYVKGSAYKDYTASLECLLGTEGNESSGIAMFDNITLEEITPKQFADYSSNGTLVTLDTDGQGITYPSTGITNGTFYDVSYERGENEEFKYPLAPAGWTKYDTATAGTIGYAADAVETEDAIDGIIPVDSATFNAHQQHFGAGSRNPGSAYSSVLMLSSETETAYCYRSSTFTVAADAAGILTARLDTFNLEGYGASLVLKNGDSVIASIEKIKNDSLGYKTYTFYIQASSNELTLSLEIWLGGQDRKNNTSKLTKGHLYVESVSYAAIEDIKDGDTVTKSAAEQFNEYKKAVDDERRLGSEALTETYYSYKTVNLSAYDYYDTADLKRPLDWTFGINGGESDAVHYGIFNAGNRPSFVPDSFTNSTNADNYNVLMLYNAAPAYSHLTYNNSFALKADTYYKVSVSVKVQIPEQENASAVGAKIMLLKDGAETKYVFTDIFDTTEKHDDTIVDEFRTYTFYIKAGSADTTMSFKISIGDASISKWCSGRIYLNGITYSDITNVTYDDAVSQIGNGKLSYAMKAEMSDAAPVDETPETPVDNGGTLDWWLIPSILFAVAILIALVGFMIRKILEKKSKKKGVVEKTSSYDRRNTLNATHNENADEEDKVSDVNTTDESYNAFDDDKAVEPTKAKKAATVETAEQTEQSADEEQTEAPAEEPTEEKAEEQADGAEPTEEATSKSEEQAEAETGEEVAEKEENAEAEEKAEKAENEKKEEKTESKAPAKEKAEKPDAFLDAFDD